LVERRIRPHEHFSRYWRDGVCDLRILVLEGEPMLAMLRVPTSGSGGKANLHQGGIGVAIDIASGLACRACLRGQTIERHPETGVELLGPRIPFWDRVVEVAVEAARSVPLGYLGVDIVIDEAQPLVLELNARPGLEIQNVNGVPLHEAHALRRAG
jgi:glutathione synthase/RimK-type ligase-like ATP-grasp enzyme